jgi:hypothetical protein
VGPRPWDRHRARHPDGRCYVIETKVEVGKNGPQQVKYFFGMLGDLVQRMNDAQASYGIAPPETGSTVASLTEFPRWPRNG